MPINSAEHISALCDSFKFNVTWTHPCPFLAMTAAVPPSTSATASSVSNLSSVSSFVSYNYFLELGPYMEEWAPKLIARGIDYGLNEYQFKNVCTGLYFCREKFSISSDNSTKLKKKFLFPASSVQESVHFCVINKLIGDFRNMHIPKKGRGV